MCLIYRIETEGGRGPYNGGGPALCWVDWARHPTPEMDRDLGADMYSRHAGWLFGFKSIEQLKAWFYRREWRDELSALGYAISVYACDDWRVSDAQAIFDSSCAKRVQRIPLD